MEILRTERTIVEIIEREDAEFFFALLNTPGWLKYVGDRKIRSIHDAQRFLDDSLIKFHDDHGFGYYVVRTLQWTPIGICGFLKKEHLRNVDFGFAFLPVYMGQGYAFETATAVLAYGAEHHSFQVIDAEVQSRNLRSKRLLEKMGFVRKGSVLSEADEPKHDLYRWHNRS